MYIINYNFIIYTHSTSFFYKKKSGKLKLNNINLKVNFVNFRFMKRNYQANVKNQMHSPFDVIFIINYQGKKSKANTFFRSHFKLKLIFTSGGKIYMLLLYFSIPFIFPRYCMCMFCTCQKYGCFFHLSIITEQS